MERGLVLVFTGNGKGKTTAALGLAFRALGHGRRVAIVQFIKGGWRTGEQKAVERFSDLLDLHVTGRGFTWESEDLSKDVVAAAEAWRLARGIIAAGRHPLVILDELTYLITYNILPEEEVVAVLAARPDGVDVAVTGRDAPVGLIEAADLVTEMREVKHPHRNGVKARAGIEY